MIKDLESLREFFKNEVKTPIFGVGVYAFNRLGPEEFIGNYRLLCLRYSLDAKLIEEDLEVLSLEKGIVKKEIKPSRHFVIIRKYAFGKEILPWSDIVLTRMPVNFCPTVQYQLVHIGS